MKALKDNAVIDQSAAKFLKRKSCVTNLITFHEATHLVVKGEPDVGFLLVLEKLLIVSPSLSGQPSVYSQLCTQFHPHKTEGQMPDSVPGML